MDCIYRINCGVEGGDVYTDKQGRQWLPDQLLAPGKTWGSVEGISVLRDEALPPSDPIAPGLYTAERHDMRGYEFQLPDANYEVRLHFAETFECHYRVGFRSMDVFLNGLRVMHEFDPYAEGGFGKPIVKIFKNIGAPGGKLSVGFNPKAMINAIEIHKAGGTPPAQRKRHKILFIGNSHCFFWAMTLNLENFVNSTPNDMQLEVHRSLVGGQDMAFHYDQTDALKKIEEGKFDDVVVQSMKPTDPDGTRKLETYLPKYVEAAKKAGSRMLLYCTWPPKGSTLDDFDKYEQQHLPLAKKLGVVFVPAGPAWRESLSRRPDLKLWNAAVTDQVHSGLWGAYLAACVFYSVLTGKAGDGKLPATVLAGQVPVDVPTAQYLQQVAWDTVKRLR